MKQIFLDANMLLDIIFRREPHLEFSQRVLMLPEYQKCTSTLNISNIFYIVKREADRYEAKRNTGLLIDRCRLLDVNSAMVKNAYVSLFHSFTDFEDAIQYYCAVAHSIDAIISRNEKDFRNSALPVYSPKKFLELFAE